jgi:hypothetical protein
MILKIFINKKTQIYRVFYGLFVNRIKPIWQKYPTSTHYLQKPLLAGLP